MSLAIIIITPVLALTLAVFLFPPIAGAVLRFSLRQLGLYLQSKTQPRRDAIVAKVKSEQAKYEAKYGKPQKLSDEDWEKIGDVAGKVASNEGKVDEEWEGIIGFFHPFCNAGGGGERVLWAAIKATQARYPKALCIVYTGDHDVDKSTILEKVESRFDIQLHPPTIVFLYLTTRNWVLASTWPHFTLLGQSIGSLVLAYDAFSLLVPDIFIDTMGYAFALALSRYLFPAVPTGAYVHYPTISTDMLDSLDDSTGVKGVNSGAGAGLKGLAKRKYWHLFAKLYGWIGGQIEVVMCNSSWTADHVNALWGPSRNKSNTILKPSTIKPVVVFPPVAVTSLASSIDISTDSERQTRKPTLLYIAQFRPEKNHPLILRSFAKFLSNIQQSQPSSSPPAQTPHLILIGSVRTNTSDETHIYNLRLLAHELKIRDSTTFITDAPWETITSHLRTSSIGLNAMWNEHFGIGVVEYQAAGLIAVVHDSGGPKRDIVVPQLNSRTGEMEKTGFHASDEEGFAAAFEEVLFKMGEREKVEMRLRARESARRFGEDEFARGWLGALGRLVDEERARNPASAASSSSS